MWHLKNPPVCLWVLYVVCRMNKYLDWWPQTGLVPLWLIVLYNITSSQFLARELKGPERTLFWGQWELYITAGHPQLARYLWCYNWALAACQLPSFAGMTQRRQLGTQNISMGSHGVEGDFSGWLLQFLSYEALLLELKSIALMTSPFVWKKSSSVEY